MASEQILFLNAPDFERAGMARKSGYKFLIKFREGKISNVIVDLPLASSLATTLLQDDVIKALFQKNEFHISLNSKFELTIKHIQHIESAKDILAEAQPA